MKYVMRRKENGIWKMQNASFRLCGATSIYDLVIKMKSAVYKCTEELCETPIQKCSDLNYSFNTQLSLKNPGRIFFFWALTYFVRALKSLHKTLSRSSDVLLKCTDLWL